MHRILALLIIYILCPVFVPVWADNTDDLFHYSSQHEEELVVKVNDSDQVILEDGRRVHLIGIESAGPPPRKYAKRDKEGNVIEEKEGVEIPLEEQALTYAQDLLEGKKVRLEFDVEPTDAQGRKQAYVFLKDGRMANTELLRQGFVHLKIRPPNVKYADKLRTAYQEAKHEQRGFLSN